MTAISFKRHRFPAAVIRYAMWLYFRFTLSVRDVEELLAQRGVEVSREAIRCWVIKFGPLFAANLRRRRCSPSPAGTWTRWWSRSADAACACGARSTTRARFWTCWSKSGALKLRGRRGHRAFEAELVNPHRVSEGRSAPG